MPFRRSVITVGVHWQRKNADLQGPAQLLVVLAWHLDFDPGVLLRIKHDAIFLRYNQNVPIRQEWHQVETHFEILVLWQTAPLVPCNVVLEALWLKRILTLKPAEAVDGAFWHLARCRQENTLMGHHSLRALCQPGETTSLDVKFCYKFGAHCSSISLLGTHETEPLFLIYANYFGPISFRSLVIDFLVDYLNRSFDPTVIRIWREYAKVCLIEKYHNFGLICSHIVQKFIYSRTYRNLIHHFWHQNMVKTPAKLLHLCFSQVSQVIEYDLTQIFNNEMFEPAEVLIF